MQELISPAGSERFVIVLALLLMVAGAVYGYRSAGRRGLVAALAGPLVYGLWQAHKYVTRYDAQSGYFGLQSVAVLLAEVVVVVLAAAALARLWNGIAGRHDGPRGRS